MRSSTCARGQAKPPCPPALTLPAAAELLVLNLPPPPPLPRQRPSALQHGEGLGDRFSVDYILQAAAAAVKGTPATGVDEVAWLRAFLAARYDLLYNWDPVARVSVKRIEIYRKLLDTGAPPGEGLLWRRQLLRPASAAAAATRGAIAAAMRCWLPPQRLPCPVPTRAAPPPPALPPAGNLQMGGPIYIDLQRRPSPLNGEPVWQIRDVYYGVQGAGGWGAQGGQDRGCRQVGGGSKGRQLGTVCKANPACPAPCPARPPGSFLVYNDPDPDRKLALLV